MQRTIFCTILISMLFGAGISNAQVDISAVTHTYNGQYAPDHVAAIWIEDSTGNYVTTLKMWGEVFWYMLSEWWQSSSGVYDYDAVTAATRSVHGELSAQWDCTGPNGEKVEKGIYRFLIEFTESNSQVISGEIDLRGGADTVSVDDTQYFSDVQAVYLPASDAEIPISGRNPAMIPLRYKMRGRKIFLFPGQKGMEIISARLHSLKGGGIATSESNTSHGSYASIIDIPGYAAGVYLVSVNTRRETGTETRHSFRLFLRD